MNAKLIGFAIATALFATGASAGQPTGRDSVYATPGTSFPSAKTACESADCRARGVRLPDCLAPPCRTSPRC
jgi:hypothetical protein